MYNILAKVIKIGLMLAVYGQNRALQSYITKKTFNSDYRLRSNEEQNNSLEKVTQHRTFKRNYDKLCFC